MEQAICKKCNGLKIWYGVAKGTYEYMLSDNCAHVFE